MQTWRRLTFLHWPYAPDVIRRFIPSGLAAAGLQLDTFDKAAWIGLVPFEIYGTPGIPHFPETNLRTYVVGPDGSRAVWFFSLEAASLLAVIGARAGYHLPYFWAKMRVSDVNGAIHYSSRRHWPHDSASDDGNRGPTGPAVSIERTHRTRSLSHRPLSALHHVRDGQLRYAQIEHVPWPLARASVLELRQTLFERAGLPSPLGAPLVHYAAELAVKIGRLI